MQPAETVSVATTAEPDTELSEQWLELARTGQRTAIETVRRFIDTVDHAVPLRMQHDLLRHAVSSAVLVNVDVDVDVDVGVDVDVASRATRATTGADPAPARG